MQKLFFSKFLAISFLNSKVISYEHSLFIIHFIWAFHMSISYSISDRKKKKRKIENRFFQNRLVSQTVLLKLIYFFKFKNNIKNIYYFLIDQIDFFYR